MSRGFESLRRHLGSLDLFGVLTEHLAPEANRDTGQNSYVAQWATFPACDPLASLRGATVPVLAAQDSLGAKAGELQWLFRFLVQSSVRVPRPFGGSRSVVAAT